VRGGKWHTLIDKVFRELNLFCSARKVLGKQGAAGVDRQTVEDFAEHEREELHDMAVVAMTPCDAWKNCSKPATCTSSTRI
jgi:hypothetical protein